MVGTKQICKVCNLEKYRIDAGFYQNGKDKRYVDKKLKQWSGLVCPDCHRERVKIRKRINSRDIKNVS